MRILLLKPLDVSQGGHGDSYRAQLGVAIPPLGLMCLSGALKREGHVVKVVDMAVSGRPEFLLRRTMQEFRPQVVGVTIIATTYAPYSRYLVGRLKELDPDVITVAGGHHASFMFREVLQYGYDYIAIGEGEITFTELVKALEEKDSVRKIQGIAYHENDELQVTGMRQPLLDLDELPYPDLDCLDISSYTVSIMQGNAAFMSMETSRGCPYDCDFCSATRMWGVSWRFKSTDRVLEEMNQIYKRGIRYVLFTDDNFLIPGHVEKGVELLRGMIDKNLGIKWMCQVRADLLAKNPDVVRLMSKAGMFCAFIGVESANWSTQKVMHKGISTHIAEDAVRLLWQNGIIPFGGFILGAPNEGIEEIKNTVEFAKHLGDCGMRVAQFTIYTPLPGSASYAKAKTANLLLTGDWSKYSCGYPVMRTQVEPWKLLYWQKMATYKFYIHNILTAVAHRIRGDEDELDGPMAEFSLQYLRNGARYLFRHMHRNLAEMAKVPLDVFKVWLELREQYSKESLVYSNQRIPVEYLIPPMRISTKPLLAPSTEPFAPLFLDTGTQAVSDRPSKEWAD